MAENIARYNVRLTGYPQLPKRDRLIAEARFCTKVESLLGSAMAVINGYEAFCASKAVESSCAISKMEWDTSVGIARAIALRGMPARDECYFEISLAQTPGVSESANDGTIKNNQMTPGR